MSPDLRLPRRYRTLLVLAAVAGPVLWLLASADGQRRTDLALMALLRRPPLWAPGQAPAPSPRACC